MGRERRLGLYEEEQRMVFGAGTCREFAQMLSSEPEGSEVLDPWVIRMTQLPAIVVSNTLQGRVQVTVFPVLTGKTGTEPVFRGAADFDLELIESRTLDGSIQELTCRPALRG